MATKRLQQCIKRKEKQKRIADLPSSANFQPLTWHASHKNLSFRLEHFPRKLLIIYININIYTYCPTVDICVHMYMNYINIICVCMSLSASLSLSPAPPYRLGAPCVCVCVRGAGCFLRHCRVDSRFQYLPHPRLSPSDDE